MIVATALEVLRIVGEDTGLAARLLANARDFRRILNDLGYRIVAGFHPIVPIMLGDAKLTQIAAALLLDQGVHVVGFAHPVVPEGAARIRVQLSAAHTASDLQRAADACAKVGARLSIVPVA